MCAKRKHNGRNPWQIALILSVLLHVFLLAGIGWLLHHRSSSGQTSSYVIIEIGRADKPTAYPADEPDRHEQPRPPQQAEPGIIFPEPPPPVREIPVTEEITTPAGQTAAAKHEERPAPRTASGNIGDTASGTAAETARSLENRRYAETVRSLIEAHKKYPLLARKGRQQGTVHVCFAIDRDGAVKWCRVEKSSGHRLLDRAASQAVYAVGRFPPPLSDADETVFMLPVRFRLEEFM